MSTALVVHSRTGSLRGTARSVGGRHVSEFLGVPYMAPPVGPLRFASPRPHPPWTGIRPALGYAPAFPQPAGSAPATAPVPASAYAEDAAYANIWTPDVRDRRPVLIYIHGGGWQLGTASTPTFDGARLAAHGKLVVVTFNYRLGPLGFGLHERLADPVTGRCANWGLQDQLALVEWVRANIPVFGGDPANITLCGTSAGGSSVWQLALLPRLHGAVRRIVPISAAHVWPPAFAMEGDDARAALEAVATRLGTDVPGLRAVDVERMQSAWRARTAAGPYGIPVASGRLYRGPVVDGDLVPAHDAHRPVPDMPVLAVVTATEGSFHTAADHPHPLNDVELHRMVRELLSAGGDEVPDDLVSGAICHYRARAGEEGRARDPFALWTEIHGDCLFRHQIVRLAERGARESTAPRYLLHFEYAVHPPGFGTPHEATSPFLFGTHDIPLHRTAFGDGPLERRVSSTFMDLVASFAHDGVPRSALAPEWPAFTSCEPRALLLGRSDGPRSAPVPKAAQLRFWDTAGWHPRTRG